MNGLLLNNEKSHKPVIDIRKRFAERPEAIVKT